MSGDAHANIERIRGISRQQIRVNGDLVAYRNPDHPDGLWMLMDGDHRRWVSAEYVSSWTSR